jgi:hypothetical protein
MMQEALDAINAAVPVWSPPIPIQNYVFFFPPHEVVAKA